MKLLTIIIMAILIAGCMTVPVMADIETDLADKISSPASEQMPANDDSGLSDNEAALIAAPSVSGALQVIGTQLRDTNGNPVQLKGISTHGIAWFPQYVNREAFRQFRREWDANVIRLAMYTAEYGGYCTDGDQAFLRELVKSGIDAATAEDLYVILDWHILSDGDPNLYLDQAREFFDYFSQLYANADNILYEICNEPNGGTTWEQIKAYAQEIIPVIRSHDPDAVILVGTPNWSQFVDQAAADPITGYENLMYTLHFYAATHKDDLRTCMTEAVQAGLPVFVSEYGICDASGNGALDIEEAVKWIRNMNELGISYVAWNLSNKEESAAILLPGCTKINGFSGEDLTPSGKWLYGMLTGEETLPEGQTPATDPDEKAIESANEQPFVSDVSEGVLSVTVNLREQWEEDGEEVFLYDLMISNTSDREIREWSAKLEFTGEFELKDSWNGSFLKEGNSLVVTPADYNRTIPENGSVRDIGFIIRGSGELLRVE